MGIVASKRNTAMGLNPLEDVDIVFFTGVDAISHSLFFVVGAQSSL